MMSSSDVKMMSDVLSLASSSGVHMRSDVLYLASSSDVKMMSDVLPLARLNVTTAPEALLERSGSVVECLTRDRGATGSSLTGVTALCS